MSSLLDGFTADDGTPAKDAVPQVKQSRPSSLLDGFEPASSTEPAGTVDTTPPKWGGDVPVPPPTFVDKVKNSASGFKDFAGDLLMHTLPQNAGGKGKIPSLDELGTFGKKAIDTVPTATAKLTGDLNPDDPSFIDKYWFNRTKEESNAETARNPFAANLGAVAGVAPPAIAAAGLAAPLAASATLEAGIPAAASLAARGAAFLAGNAAGSSTGQLAQTGKVDPGQVAADTLVGAGTEGAIHGVSAAAPRVGQAIGAAAEKGPGAAWDATKAVANAGARKLVAEPLSEAQGYMARKFNPDNARVQNQSTAMSERGIEAPETRMAAFGLKNAQAGEAAAADVGPNFDAQAKTETARLGEPFRQQALDSQDDIDDAKRAAFEHEQAQIPRIKAIEAKKQEIQAAKDNLDTQRDQIKQEEVNGKMDAFANRHRLNEEGRQRLKEIADNSVDIDDLHDDIKNGFAEDAAGSINDFNNKLQDQRKNVIGKERNRILTDQANDDLSVEAKTDAKRLEAKLESLFDTGGDKKSTFDKEMQTSFPDPDAKMGSFFRAMLDFRDTLGKMAKYDSGTTNTASGAAKKAYQLASDYIAVHNPPIRALDSDFRETFVGNKLGEQAGTKTRLHLDEEGNAQTTKDATRETIQKGAKNESDSALLLDNMDNFNKTQKLGFEAPVDDVRRAHNAQRAETTQELHDALGDRSLLSSHAQAQLALLDESEAKLQSARDALEQNRQDKYQAGLGKLQNSAGFDTRRIGIRQNRQSLQRQGESLDRDLKEANQLPNDIVTQRRMGEFSQNTAKKVLARGQENPQAILDARAAQGLPVLPEHEAIADAINNVKGARTSLARDGLRNPAKPENADPLHEAQAITYEVNQPDVPKSLQSVGLNEEDAKTIQFLQDHRTSYEDLKAIKKKTESAGTTPGLINITRAITSRGAYTVMKFAGLATGGVGYLIALPFKMAADASLAPHEALETQARLKTYAQSGDLGKDLKAAFGIGDKSAKVLADTAGSTGKPLQATFVKNVLNMYEKSETAQAALHGLVASGVAVKPSK